MAFSTWGVWNMVSVESALSLMRSGQYEKALHDLEACPSVSPEIELNKGMCYAALGRISRAKGVLEGLRLSGHDRHAARLADRLAEDVPQLDSYAPGAITPPDTGAKKHALLCVVFAALGALLLLEGVYVGAGLVGGPKSSPPPAGNAAHPSPAQKIAVSEPDGSGVRAIDTGLATDTTSLRGRWQSVDFVQRIDDYQPGHAPSRTDFFRARIAIRGRCPGQFERAT